MSFECPLQNLGDKFGESLGGSQAPPSFWKSSDFPGSSPNFPGSFSATPRKFPHCGTYQQPEVPRKFPKLPRKFPKLPQRSAPLSGGSLTPSRHLDVSRRKLTPHCLATIFDSQLPSPKLSPKMPPKLSLAHKRGPFSSFKITPAVRVTARQLRDKNCLAAIFAPRHQGVSFGPLQSPRLPFHGPEFPEACIWELLKLISR